jgi:hypothetical protein
MSFNDQFERIRARLHRRAFAYRALFKTPGGDLGPAAEIVMRDLAHYCRANVTSLQYSKVTGMADPIATAFAEGRRDVYNRILGQLQLSPEHIERIAHNRTTDE